MPQQTKIFRVFVSSTFTDMREERRILQRDVFPKLESFCEKNGARFQGVDLRWGVNEELQLEQKTLQTCFNEIDRCQKISPKPNFLILLGDKYGWQPIPERIPKDEMDLIITQILEEDIGFLIKVTDADFGWYRLDSNAIPEEYVLQPREGKYEKYAEWEKEESRIRKILQSAIDKLDVESFPDEKRVNYYASATHQEIIRGALNPNNKDPNPEEHIFAFIRNVPEMPQGILAKGYRDLTDDKTDTYCAVQLNKLKTKLESKLKDHYISYTADWKTNQTEIKDPKWFADEVYGRLERIIEQQIKEIKLVEENEREVHLHEEFQAHLIKHFKGRDAILEKIRNYLSNNTAQKIMSLIGTSGSGKSSVIAKAIEECKTKNKNALIVYRFLGTTSQSSGVISLLESVCKQLAPRLKTSLEELAGEGRKDSLHDLYTMSEIFRRCLERASPEQPVFVFLDALDQLSDTDNAKSLSWLPDNLPDNARILVSATEELEEQLKLRKTSNEQLVVLKREEANDIIVGWLDAMKRKLTDTQKNYVLNKFDKTGLALYLKLAFENAKEWHHYDEVPEMKEDVPGIINDFFDLLGNKHHPEFVENAISYLLSGRYQGLTENEILEVLVFDKEFWEKVFLKEVTHPDHEQELVDMKKALEESENGPKVLMKIPIAVWSRLFLDLEPFLTERDADGVPIITFFHRQFNEVLRERYKLPTLSV